MNSPKVASDQRFKLNNVKSIRALLLIYAWYNKWVSSWVYFIRASKQDLIRAERHKFEPGCTIYF